MQLTVRIQRPGQNGISKTGPTKHPPQTQTHLSCVARELTLKRSVLPRCSILTRSPLFIGVSVRAEKSSTVDTILK